ncbi:MAG: heavy metal-binding domain-containing protein [Actinobacteria bacterium]|nr:heavy metal-binding domain-containing protein [Actinomycetota bacterium]
MTTQIELSTTNEIPNRKIASHNGIVVGVGTEAFGPVTSTKAKIAYGKAIAELKSSAQGLGSNAVIGISVTSNGSGFPFFRAQTVIISGTAVKVI